MTPTTTRGIPLFAALTIGMALVGCRSDDPAAQRSQAPADHTHTHQGAAVTDEDPNPNLAPMTSSEAAVESEVTLADLPSSKDEWRERLTPEQYYICFQKGTEPPGSGKYYKTKTPGTYHCVACNQALFESDAKYDSGSGWPAFFKPAAAGVVSKKTDLSHGMLREEVLCSRCGAHLGHVFNDGPKPTGLRYCINSIALRLEPADVASKE